MINSINDNKNPNQDKQGGFTIVELLVVLGIGAAILVLALRFIPTLQKKNRDTARSSDISQIVAAINGYITNNNGLPDEWGDVRDTIDSLSHYDKGTSTTASNSVNVANTASNARPTTTNEESFNWTHLFSTTTAQDVFLNAGTTYNLGDVNEDLIMIIAEAKCEVTATTGVKTGKVEQGGLRQMAISYKLETNDQVACQDI